MANSRDIGRLVGIRAARTVTGSIYDVTPKKPAPRKRKPANPKGAK